MLPFLVSQQDNVDLGELMFSLCYLPTAGRLTITIIKARNLKAMDITGASGGPFLNSSSPSGSNVVPYEVSNIAIKHVNSGTNFLGLIPFQPLKNFVTLAKPLNLNEHDNSIGLTGLL
jgi:hypothetical protein